MYSLYQRQPSKAIVLSTGHLTVTTLCRMLVTNSTMSYVKLLNHIYVLSLAYNLQSNKYMSDRQPADNSLHTHRKLRNNS